MTFEIEVDQWLKYIHSIGPVWNKTKYSYRCRSDAEWMAKYLELVKDIGPTRVVEVYRYPL